MRDKKVTDEALRDILEKTFELNLKQSKSPYIAIKEACDKAGVNIHQNCNTHKLELLGTS